MRHSIAIAYFLSDREVRIERLDPDQRPRYIPHAV